VDYILVVFGVGGREQVEGDAQPLPGVEELRVVPINDFLRGYFLSFRSNGYGGPVAVAAGNHQHLVALEPVVAGKDIGGKVTPRHVAQV
jgi:hypothetical protein